MFAMLKFNCNVMCNVNDKYVFFNRNLRSNFGFQSCGSYTSLDSDTGMVSYWYILSQSL